MPTAVQYLRWCDVDPAGRAFDPGPARRLVEALLSEATDGVRSRRKLAAGWDRDQLQQAIDRALLAEYGPWVSGWDWAATEGGGGGPIRGWCCAPHSLLCPQDTELSNSVERVVSAVTEWRTYLEELAGEFVALRKATSDLALDEGVERAAARLLPLIIQRTGTNDAWYATFERVFGWYLESAGHDPESFREVLRSVVSGRFQSWVEPSTEALRTACSELGYEVALAAESPKAAEDALATWRRVRTEAFTNAPYPRRRDPVRIDGHRRYIEGPERARDPDRAARMTQALFVPPLGQEDEPLTFEQLAEWQQIVLGEPAAFRTADAYAKKGRERYGLDDKTERKFRAALAEANELTQPASVRAARVYLDVCFFHPFADGNARAARLSLDHVLTRAGLALHTVEPLFVVARSAGDGEGAWALCWLVEYLIGTAS